MLDALKTIILDHQESVLPTGVPRRTDITPVAGKAAVCIGVRRSGKSTCLFQIMQRLVDSGISRQNILYLNFFDDRLHPLHTERIGMQADGATRKRELTALYEAIAELDCTTATIVTRNEEETIEKDGRTVTVVPAWKWLLKQDE